mgnify:CR=1 FL=1
MENEKTEAEFIVNQVIDYRRQGYALKDIVVLYRTNAQSRALEEFFLENNISYKIVGGIKFYQRKEVKDIIAYLRFLHNQSDLVSLKRIINVPARGIGNVTFISYLAGLQSSQKDEQLSSKKDQSIESFKSLVADLEMEIAAQPTSRFIKHLIQKIKYKEYLDDSADNSEERWENIAI